jgi:hypothetical protein
VAAVDRTRAEPGADVMMTLAYELPDDAGGSVADTSELRGVIDFRSERARVANQETSFTFDQPGADRQWDLTNPQWALDALRLAARAARLIGENRFEVELDPEQVGELTRVGVAAAWQQVRADVALDAAGRIQRIEVDFTAPTEPAARITVSVEFTDFPQTAPNIQPPPA